MMIRLNSLSLFISLTVLLINGCKRSSSLGQVEYVRFLTSKESGLSDSKVLNAIRYKCKLQTPELITLINSRKNYSNISEFDLDKKDYDSQLNFVFVIEDETASNHQVSETVFKKEAYSQLLSYSNNQLQNDFELQLEDGTTLPCCIAHIEAANSIHPVIRIAVAFNSVKSKIKDYTLIFDDKIFNTGKIKFHFGKDVFENLPQLKI